MKVNDNVYKLKHTQKTDSGWILRHVYKTFPRTKEGLLKAFEKAEWIMNRYGKNQEVSIWHKDLKIWPNEETI